MQQFPNLFPVPRRVQWGSTHLQLPGELPLVLGSHAPELLPVARSFQQAVEGHLGISLPLMAADTPGTAVRVEMHAAIAHPQGYLLAVQPGGIRLVAATAAGAAHGLATLKQLLLAGRRTVPTVEISDHPDFARRGVMLDVSRGKVPTMATLLRLVDRLADLKLNELQLYTEHTFAYRRHRVVWQNFSPLTAEEILQLDRYCRERFIDLVPNQNSFGHMTQWLIHAPYKHLAETHDGWTAWGTHYDEPFSFCPQEPGVLPLLEELYDELLPNFSSPYFNVGCDETLDVGQGRSKAVVEQRGQHRVYLDFLLQIYERVKARGKTMQFWGDIIVEAPELIAELPKDVVALEWGYEAEHPFDQRCGHFAQAGIPFYVCPGTSTWNSLLGRTDNALANLRSAAENGLKHGAGGYLITMWGDRGHQDYQPVAYLGIAYGAALSWGVAANRGLDRTADPTSGHTADRMADAISYVSQWLGDRSGRIGRILYDLGNVYQAVGKTPPNASVLGQILHQGFKVHRAIKGVTTTNLDHAAATIRSIAAALDEVTLTGPDAQLVQRELQSGVAMSLHACELGKLKLALAAGEEPATAHVAALAADLDAIMAEHRTLWLARNRSGGLEEMSLKPLREIAAGYKSLLRI